MLCWPRASEWIPECLTWHGSWIVMVMMIFHARFDLREWLIPLVFGGVSCCFFRGLKKQFGLAGASLRCVHVLSHPLGRSCASVVLTSGVQRNYKAKRMFAQEPLWRGCRRTM